MQGWLPPCTERNSVERIVDIGKDMEQMGWVELSWGELDQQIPRKCQNVEELEIEYLCCLVPCIFIRECF